MIRVYPIGDAGSEARRPPGTRLEDAIASREPWLREVVIFLEESPESWFGAFVRSDTPSAKLRAGVARSSDPNGLRLGSRRDR